MFNEDFYPTPPSVVELMIAPIRPLLVTPKIQDRKADGSWENQYQKLVILEPSCGKGDILDYLFHVVARREKDYGKLPIAVEGIEREGDYPYEIKNRNESYRLDIESAKKAHKVYCIESDPSLQAITESKGYNLIEHDFLNYQNSLIFDLILMNPPFSNGDEHLVEAISIMLQNGGKIICLLNRQTIDNPYSKMRQVLAAYIKKFGSVEYVEGHPFSTAERTSNVEVVIVRLEIPPKKDIFDPFENVSKGEFSADKNQYAFTEEVLNNQLSRINVIDSLVDSQTALNSAYIDFVKAAEKIEFYSQPFGNSFGKSSAWNILKDEKNPRVSYNAFCEASTRAAWAKVFEDVKFKEIMTSAVRSNFDKFTQTQGVMGFNRKNVEKLFEMLFLNKDQILQDNIVAVFEMLTSFDKDNRVHVEGWATNDCYQVNKKVILPHLIDPLELSKWSSKFHLSYHGGKQKADDLDRALCVLTGKKINKILTIVDALSRKFDQIGTVSKGENPDTTCESEFFDIRFYKKGTCHVTFKDKFLYEEFNRRALIGKNWLKPEGAKKYKSSEKEAENGTFYS